MAVYLIADVQVTDESWIPAYVSSVHEIVEKHGGKYLSRSANITHLEGDDSDSTIIALLKFPSLEAVQAFADDPDYATNKAARQAGSISKFRVIDDTDVAGVLSYLPKG